MNKEQISDNPEEVKSHYERLSLPDKRGQARYRCKKCGYELICTGRGRLIVHIVGQLIPGTPQKQVKYCGNPDEGLKVALINYMKTDKFHSRSKFQRKLKTSRDLPTPIITSKNSCSSFSETVLGKRSAESSPKDEISKVNESSASTNSIGEMEREELLGLLNILRLMDPGKFELALCIKRFSSSRQSVLPMMMYGFPSLLSLDDSIRLLQQYQLLLQSQNVLWSLGLSGFPPIIGATATNPSLSTLNSLITPTIPMISSSFLSYPQLFEQVNRASVNDALVNPQDRNMPTAADVKQDCQGK
eukprot:CAMPEP_0173132854 /NCGR_PEP_ID=MMETSP1105-20130129/387_1 /TAXON_ID=2985 /ORGANISM="Ochromonas sp., Strain BG-1" /LENGTH=301 /DNA_ID=CAMNT_0014044427 /DNA_START=973 /DNA_END=1878 /DNA_ORIENTATION=-